MTQLEVPTLTETATLTMLVTGSRWHKGVGLIGTKIYETIDEAVRSRGIRHVKIRHGACPTGADLIVHEFCESETEWFEIGSLTLEEQPRPADWDLCGPNCPPDPHRKTKHPGDVHHPGLLDDYCPKAGTRRNRAMVVEGADVCLAFPLHTGSYGTRNCMRVAKSAGIEVRWW